MYRVRLETKAERGLRAIRVGDPRAYRRLRSALRALQHDPRPVGSKKLAALGPRAWRIRVGVYRILYTIDEETIVVAVFNIEHRSQVYR